MGDFLFQMARRLAAAHFPVSLEQWCHIIFRGTVDAQQGNDNSDQVYREFYFNQSLQHNDHGMAHPVNA